MRRRPICKRRQSAFHDLPRRENRLSGISSRFRKLSQSYRQVAYVLLTRPPLALSRRRKLARLACIRHAASVRPEPGSNSPLKCESSAELFRADLFLPSYRDCSPYHVVSYSLFSFQGATSPPSHGRLLYPITSLLPFATVIFLSKI